MVQQRVPAALQAMFTEVNRGNESFEAKPVYMAPQEYTGQSTVYESRKKFYSSYRDVLLKKQQRLQAIQEDGAAAVEPQTSTKAELKAEEWDGTLQEYFDHLLLQRGYNIHSFETLSTGYYNKVTELQLASYGPRMIEIVKTNNVAALREVMDWGLSPNPCNQFAESLVHMACRRGHTELLKVFVEAGACLQISDDYGRTPAHDACWAANPAFDVVDVLLKKDNGMFFMKDKRGSLPLSYVHKDDWAQWRNWLDTNIDNYFPQDGAACFCPSDLVLAEPNTIPLAFNKTEFSLELIRMISAGDLNPREAMLLANDDATYAETVDETEWNEDDDSDYDSDDYDSDYDSEYDSEDMEVMEFVGMANIQAR